jgi:hypothetical protein
VTSWGSIGGQTLAPVRRVIEQADPEGRLQLCLDGNSVPAIGSVKATGLMSGALKALTVQLPG